MLLKIKVKIKVLIELLLDSNSDMKYTLEMHAKSCCNIATVNKLLGQYNLCGMLY